MRILITHEIFPPDIHGGGESVVLKLAKGLQEKGHYVEVLTSGKGSIKKYDGIRTRRIRLNRYLMNLMMPWILIRAKGFDIIQTSSGNMCFPSWMAAKILNKPIVCTVHHMFGKKWKVVRGGFVGTLFYFLEKLFLGRSYDALVIQNKSTMELLRGISNSKKAEISPGINYDIFQTKTKKHPLAITVGNLSMDESNVKTKGIDKVIEAARMVPDIEFMIVGKGPYLDKIKSKAPKNIIFSGSMNVKQLAKAYNMALISLQPSVSEGFGLSIAEAMASGCAIVSTINLGQKGILLKSGGPNEIASAVSRLIKNRKSTESAGRENRMIARKFSWKNFLDGYDKLYADIILSKKKV